MLHIVIRKRGSSRNTQAPHQEKFRGHTPSLAEPVLIPVNDLHRSIHMAGAVIDERNLRLRAVPAAHNQGVGSSGAGADSIDGAAPGLDPDHVVSEITDLLLDL